jgi:CheY-like chemotaxis protein
MQQLIDSPHGSGRSGPALCDAAGRRRGPAGDIAVLVVEDDPDVRELAVDILIDYGFTVLSAANAREALAILDRDRDIDLLFTDIVMPGMNGVELAAAALRRDPGLKVLLASGYCDPSVLAPLSVELDSAFIGKPYRPHEIAARIRRLFAD